jgi:periplasmic copper chaperone A
MRYFLAGLLCLAAAPVTAHSYSSGQVRIGHAWALPSDGPTAQAFAPLANNAKQADALISATSPRAANIRFQKGNTPLNRVELLPNKPVPMRANGVHLRLEGLKQPLRWGDKVPVTLRFQRAAAVTVEVWVEPKAYAGPPAKAR